MIKMTQDKHPYSGVYVYDRYKYWLPIIDKLTHKELAIIWRFAPPEHEIFADSQLYLHFRKRLFKLGGITSEISKEIGWDDVYDIGKIIERARRRGGCDECN